MSTWLPGPAYDACPCFLCGYVQARVQEWGVETESCVLAPGDCSVRFYKLHTRVMNRSSLGYQTTGLTERRILLPKWFQVDQTSAICSGERRMMGYPGEMLCCENSSNFK
jgi:hypothetical protein